MSQGIYDVDQQNLIQIMPAKSISKDYYDNQSLKDPISPSPFKNSRRNSIENDDMFCFNSMYTISRQSLQFIPQSYNSDLYTKYEDHMLQICKSSKKSLQNSEKQFQENNLCETQLPNQLGLRLSESSIVEDIQNYNEEIKPIKNKEKHRTNIINQTKHLVRHLRRFSRQNRGSLKGDFHLVCDSEKINISGGEINCIMNDKRQLCGVLIRDGDRQFKIRIQKEGQEIAKMELWNNVLQFWEDFTFKAKLYHSL